MTVSFTTTYVLISCYKCGVSFGVSQSFRNQLRESHESFYCPNGHSQHFYGKTDAEKIQEKLDRERAAHERTRCNVRAANRRTEKEKRSHSATKGRLTKTHNRIKKGVCPFCNRHFSNLQRHMDTKHGDEPCH